MCEIPNAMNRIDDPEPEPTVESSELSDFLDLRIEHWGKKQKENLDWYNKEDKSDHFVILNYETARKMINNFIYDLKLIRKQI